MKIRNFKQEIGWRLFDFVKSNYSAIIFAVIFPVYLMSAIAGDAGIYGGEGLYRLAWLL